MKILKKIAISVLIIHLVCNCFGDVTENPGTAKIPTFKLKKIKEIALADEAVTIGMFWDIDIENELFLITDLVHAKGIFLFDNKGKLVKKVGRAGQGPGEYHMPNAACFSGKRIFAVGAYRLLSYSKDGTLIKMSKLPFRGGICNGIYPDGKGGCYLLSYNRYNNKENTIFHVNINGDLIDSFSPVKEIPQVFDVFAPATGLCLDGTFIFQFFNFTNEISIFNNNGKKLNGIKLNSPFYSKPDFGAARKLKGHKQEKEFMIDFARIYKLFNYRNGFITVILKGIGTKTSDYKLELWDKKFNKMGNIELHDGMNIIGVNKQLIISGDVEEQATKLSFWEIQPFLPL